MHYLLFYEKVSDYAERQEPFQAAHRVHLEGAVRRGELIFGGSLANPVDGSAMLLFQTDSLAVVETFAAGDPYVTNGVIARWWIRSWDVVVGTGMENRKS